jgi:SAM-dependent methyltransferase
MSTTEVAAERTHWNAVARSFQHDLQVDLDRLHPLDAAFLDCVGDVRGKRVLDLGCGSGYHAVLLALRGAEVYAIDVADEWVRLTRARAYQNGVGEHVHALVMSAYALAFPPESFDVACGVAILHHLAPQALGRELRRVLRPDGRAVFLENSANNPFLMLARRLCGHFGIPKWSTDGEYPLRRAQIAALAAAFGGTCTVTYPFFEFFRLLDQKLWQYRSRTATRLCEGLDAWLGRVAPALRPYSYKQVVLLRPA